MSFNDGFALGYALGQSRGGGGGDSGEEEWKIPDSWLPIPDPQPNQVIVYTELDYPSSSFAVYFRSTLTGTVDWGDGWVDSVAYPYVYTVGHYYQKAGRYVVTITVDKSSICYEGADDIDLTAYYYNYELGHQIDYGVANHNWIKAAKFGSNIYLDNSTTVISSRAENSLVYIKFLGEIGVKNFGNFRTLKKIEFIYPPKYMGDLYGCYNLQEYDCSNILDGESFDLVLCRSIKKITLNNYTLLDGYNQTTRFYECTSLKEVYLPNVTTIQKAFFYNCFSLEKVIAPNCTKIIGFDDTTDNAIFTNCVSLKELVVANNCTFSGNVFKNCPRRYPKPDGSK